ncbi:MAG: serine/threonine protein kinase [Deltaproteobacteria bacterium]|nr:serine/threonine protein kinase [Deltaproteobacteria bacterium]
MKICPSCHESFNDEMEICPRDGNRLIDVKLSSLKLQKGKKINEKFVLDSRIGTGSYSQVWKAFDENAKQFVALKILDFYSTSTDEIMDSVSRFFREAYAASQIGHNNIIKVYDFGDDGFGHLFLSMELVDGISFSQHLRELQWPDDFGKTIDLLIKITEGIETAHKSGIVHRDLKSDNILIYQKNGVDEIKILDFGTAKILDDPKLAEISKDYIYGTPSYMSPEQAKGKSVDHRSDIYALGVIMFEVFTGVLPFKGYTSSVLIQHIQKPPPNPMKINEYMPKKLSDAVIKCLKKERKSRFQTMSELREELQTIRKKFR